MELHDYRADDFDSLWELDQQCFPPEIAYSRRELSYYLKKKSAVVLVASDDAKLLGFAVGHVDARGFGHVVTLDVAPGERKRGLGSTLMQGLETRFRDAGCGWAFLEVAVNNRAALSFYKKHGYTVLKTLRRYYPGGLDGLLMGKQLE